MPTESERQSIRRFLATGLLFSIPFLVYAALVVALDPFNYFGFSHLIDDAFKRPTAGRLHYTLWKTIEFQRDPRPNLLLGDSRMDQIDAAEIEALTGDRYFNFSYGGGTIPELVDTFEFARSVVPLEKVYIGVSIVNLNGSQTRNRFRESQSILANPLLYLVNRMVFKAMYHSVVSQLRGEAARIENPNIDRDAFWKRQLDVAIVAHYGHYVYSSELFESLRELARYCDEHDIELTFVIPPTHVDLQAKIDEFGLRDEADAFYRDLRTLGRVIDLDFPNAFTRDRDNFSDPFHTGHNGVVQQSIWGAHPDSSIRR